MHIESLIQDLAFILLLGAVVTVLFKWIKQPVVLGYIVAGFLASPNFTYLPSVTTAENIQFWAEIDIVVLLFSLGLEFSFKKLVNSGASAIVTALIIVTGMMAAGVGAAIHRFRVFRRRQGIQLRHDQELRPGSTGLNIRIKTGNIFGAGKSIAKFFKCNFKIF